MGHRKKRKQSKDTDHEERSYEGDGRGAHQRPNCCDTLMLSLVCFFIVIVIAVSIPLLLTALGKMDIPFISDKLKVVGKTSK